MQTTERMGRFFADNGLPKGAGRTLGYLLTCDPAEQTFDEIVDALGASKSTISVATRTLIQLGLIERFGVGERKDRYRVRPDAWTMMLKQDIAAAAALHALANEGLDTLAKKPAATRARLRELRDFTAFLQEQYAPILARWERQR